MKNAVNSMKNLIKVNIEPSLVGNYLEGVTTRVEPTAEAMVIITHSIESNPIEKRSAPFVGDEIVWSCGKPQELGGNDLATFGKFIFNMAGTAIGNKIIKMVSRFPIAIERNIRADVVNIKALSKLGFSKTAKLASMIISLAGFNRLLTPVLSLIPFNITFVSPVVRASSNGSRTPNSTLKRTILSVSLSSLVSEGFATVRTHFSNQSFIAWIVCARVNLTAELQKAFTAASLFTKRMFGELITANNTRFGLDSAYTPTFPRTKPSVSTGYFLATNNTFCHNSIIA